MKLFGGHVAIVTLEQELRQSDALAGRPKACLLEARNDA